MIIEEVRVQDKIMQIELEKPLNIQSYLDAFIVACNFTFARVEYQIGKGFLMIRCFRNEEQKSLKHLLHIGCYKDGKTIMRIVLDDHDCEDLKDFCQYHSEGDGIDKFPDVITSILKEME